MKLRPILQRNHSIDDILFENLVRIATNLVKALSCLVDFVRGNLAVDLLVVEIIAWLIVICLLQVGIHAPIKDLTRIVAHLILLLLLLILDIEWCGFVHLAHSAVVVLLRLLLGSRLRLI